MSQTNVRQRAANLDASDELARFRAHFHIPPAGAIYLDGNSLGLLCHHAEAAILRTLDEWKRLAIEGWTAANPPWFFLAEELARLTAPLIGAAADEVIVTNSTTVNLHQLLATLYSPHGTKTRILSDELAFPSDTYALKSHLALRGLDPREHLIRV
jgi:kynureninase